MDDLHSLYPFDFFSGLNHQQQRALLQISTKRVIAKDEMIFTLGSPSNEIFILLDGRVKVFELSKEGKEVILWFCFQGELFGMAEVMNRGYREVNAQAGTEVTVLAIKSQEFERFLNKHTDLAMQVIRILSYRLRELGDVLLNLASDDVTSRVVKLLSRLTTRYGRATDNGWFLDIALTHQEMADMIGTSRQTVTTILGNLKRQGVLRTQQRYIVIEDIQWVEETAGRLSTPLHDALQFPVLRHSA
jgi:CRP/FNR family transcriptional regulator